MWLMWLMRICCFLALPGLGELRKPGPLARGLALGRPPALLCGLVRGVIRLIIVNYIRVAVPMTGWGRYNRKLPQRRETVFFFKRIERSDSSFDSLQSFLYPPSIRYAHQATQATKQPQLTLM